MSTDALDDLLRAYTSVASRHKLPAMRRTRCDITSRFFTVDAEVGDVIRSVRASAEAGWLGFQSGNVPLPSHSAESSDPGVLIDGEIATRSMTVHVRYRGDGWIVTTYVAGRGADFLADEVTMLTSSGHLEYERLWAIDSDGVLQQVHARLLPAEVRK